MNKPTDWRWTTAEVIALLALRNTQSAMAGYPCPVAARVLMRMELASL